MNIYGDRGNAIALQYRCEARGIAVEVVDVRLGDPFDPAAFDIVIIGGGQDREQRRIAEDLQSRAEALRAAAADGMPMLAVCGGFQLFGRRYVDQDGGTIPGISIFDMETRHPGAAVQRCIGDIVLTTPLGEVAGFENHGGRTYLADTQAPFGRVVRGYGNNAEDGGEGARTNNVIGTYLHGSLLPKNPAIADELILAALRRRYGEAVTLTPIDDAAEQAAHTSAVTAARRSPAIKKDP